jgi:hypothetical protein
MAARRGTVVEIPTLPLEKVADPAESARVRAIIEQTEQNSRWLSEHWPELLPLARGKFVAVAAQEAFIADSAEEARAWARRVHPEDRGALVQYVFPTLGPRFYGSRVVSASANAPGDAT